MENTIIVGSLSAISKRNNISLAEGFLSCDVIIVVDTSGSMDSHDSRGNQRRYDVACQELANLQNNLPGKIAVIAFSSDVQFCPSGYPIYFGGGTDLTKALKFSKIADTPGMRFIVISDGWPDDPNEALKVAKTYKNRIDTIYVGPEDEREGQEFLRKLAAASGGQHVTADKAKELAAAAQTLLLKG